MGKITTLKAYVGKMKGLRAATSAFPLKKLEKVEQIKCKVIIRKEITNISVEINEIKKQKNKRNSIKSKAGSLTRRRKKKDRSPVRLTGGKKEDTTNTRNKGS